MAERYKGPPRPSRSEDEWHDLARAALLALLAREHAVTVVEMEAKLADRTYDVAVCNAAINPHHLTTAKNSLFDEGLIEPYSASSKGRDDRGRPVEIVTWSLPRERPRKTAIDRAAERKRALMSRWLSWGRRHLLGDAGEQALALALEESDQLMHVTGSTSSVLDVPTGEVDNSAVHVARADNRLVPVQVMFEVKNRREHYYARDRDVQDFLRKAAVVQDACPDQLILPVFVARRRHWTLWEQGREEGFLPATVMNQLVNRDPDLGAEEWEVRFGEVRDNLFEDLVALSTKRHTTNRHRGIATKAIPRYAIEYALRWSDNHVNYLP